MVRIMTHINLHFLSFLSNGVARYALISLLALSAANVQATAPRINAEMFGEAKQAEIVGYELAPMDANARKESELISALIIEAFKAANMAPVMDTLPSKQLASYAVTNHESVGLIGNPSDLPTDSKIKYLVTVAAFRNNEPVSLILNNDKRGTTLHKAFTQGLQTILKNGKYAELLDKYLDKAQIPADYTNRLYKLNPGWK